MFSFQFGFCGIPPALVQRYAEELNYDIYDVGDALDQIRLESLLLIGRRRIPNDYLGDSCIGPVIDCANYENTHNWLVSIGLPMYETHLTKAGYRDLIHISTIREDDLVYGCSISDQRHVRILMNAIGVLNLGVQEGKALQKEGAAT